MKYVFLLNIRISFFFTIYNSNNVHSVTAGVKKLTHRYDLSSEV